LARLSGLSLRNRLLIAFIVLAFLPCVVLTLFISEKLSRSLAFWGRPGVERTVDSSVGAARLALRALKDHLRDGVDGVAEGRPAPGGLDVLRIYELEDGRYTLREAEPSAAGLLLAPEAIEGALHSTRVIERPEGFILAVAALDSAAQRVVVGGYALPPELFVQIAEARRGATLFDRLRLYLTVSRRWIWISTFLLAGLVLGVALIVAQLMASTLTRPISGLVVAMEQVGRGEPAPVLPVAGGPEMAYLVRSFNRMAGELDRSRRALRRAERLAAWQDLARKVAHEINNPLTPIQFALHRLKQELGTAPEGIAAERQARASEALDAILGEVETLRHVAGEFSRLGKLPTPELQPVDLGPLLQETAELYRTPGIEVTLDLPPELPAVDADPRLIRMVLVNLLKNAVEAMPGGGSIAIRGRPIQNGNRQSVEIQVADSGPGIPPDLQDRIGEPYVSAKRGGSGLGIAVALKILDDHGAAFELSNRPEGGALARITLPIAGARADSGPGLRRGG
jgi:nitrogen fixation/metabolism regulation signal transduction histidine kinase